MTEQFGPASDAGVARRNSLLFAADDSRHHDVALSMRTGYCCYE
jgi:hypothetical protein